MNSEIGLESLLKPLAVEDGAEVLERVEEYIQAREIQETETADSEACF